MSSTTIHLQVTELGSILIFRAYVRTHCDHPEGGVDRAPENRQPRTGQNGPSAPATAVGGEANQLPPTRTPVLSLGLKEKIKTEDTEGTSLEPATSKTVRWKCPEMGTVVSSEPDAH